MKRVSTRPGFIWQAVIIFLIFFDGLLLVLSIINNLRPISLQLISEVDLVVSIILLILFLWRIVVVGDKFAHLKRYWYLYFSFIPLYFIAINAGLLDYILIFKVLNIFKIVSFYLYMRRFSAEALKYQRNTRLVYAIAIFLLVVVVCSFVFFAVEHGVNPQVSTFEDALWFVLQTITTVGYGDIIPVTAIGRVIGVISMLSALVLTSIVTSVATFSLIEKFREGTADKVDGLDKKLGEIDGRLDDVDNSQNIKDIQKDLKELKGDINDIKEFIRGKP